MAEKLKTPKCVSENLEQSSSSSSPSPVHTTATNTECCCPYCMFLNQSINSISSHLSCPYFENFKASLNSHLSPFVRGGLTLPTHCDFRLMSDGRSQAPTNLHCQCQTIGIDCTRTGVNCLSGFNHNAFTGNHGCATNFIPSQLNQMPSPVSYPVYVPVYIPVPDLKTNFVKKDDKACQVELPYPNCDCCEENPESLSIASFVISDRTENTARAKSYVTSKKTSKDIVPKKTISTLYYSKRNNKKDDIYNYEIVRDEPTDPPDMSELYLQIPQSPPDHDNSNEMMKNISGSTDDKSEIRRDDLRFYSATSIHSANSNFNPQVLMNQLIIPSKTRSRESMTDHFHTNRLENDSMTQNDTESLDSQRPETNDDEEFDDTPRLHGENMRSFPRLSLPNRDNGEPDKNAALMMLSLLTSGSDSSGLRKVLDGIMTGVSPPDQPEPIPQTSPIDSNFEKPNPNLSKHDNDETVSNFRLQQRPRLRKRNGHSMSFQLPSNQNSNQSLNFN